MLECVPIKTGQQPQIDDFLILFNRLFGELDTLLKEANESKQVRDEFRVLRDLLVGNDKVDRGLDEGGDVNWVREYVPKNDSLLLGLNWYSRHNNPIK